MRPRIAKFSFVLFEKDYVKILILALVVLFVFWHCLQLPLIQDDWGFAEAAMFNNLWKLLVTAFDPRGKLFYRPMGISYLLIMMSLFKDNAVPLHVIALLIHILNSFLVCKIITRISSDPVIGFCTSLVYAAAVAIHLDALCWAVGIYDLAGALFFFSSFWFFLNRRFKWSAALMLFGLLFKEALVVTPLVLWLFSVSSTRLWKQQDMRNSLSDISLHIVFVVTVLCCRFAFGDSISSMSPSHPYSIKWQGGHILQNLSLYFTWMFQAVVPLQLNLQASRLISVLMASVWLLSLGFQKIVSRGTALKLILWSFIGLMPVMFLPNHSYRYYATYSLAPFSAVWLISLSSFGRLFKNRMTVRTIWLVWCLCCVGLSTQKSNEMFSQGLGASLWLDGTNSLIMRAEMTNLVKKDLLEQAPQLASGTIILLDNVDLSAFDDKSGPRVWYQNQTIDAFSLEDKKTIQEGRPVVFFRREKDRLKKLVN